MSANSAQSAPVMGGQNNPADVKVPGFMPPLSRAAERVTKKPFGIFITPQTSPVQPEKFHGYHTGTDFEIFPEELKADVQVNAICNGKLLLKEYASGYGGVAVETCTLNGAPITVVYGHLKLSSIPVKVGDKLVAGDTLGILGANKSAETSGERKHLHLGIYEGAAVSILGYVQSKAALSDWIDPCLYVCGK
ncbi:MAG: M23 family metallopeptidase [Parcubacteria group bacterium]